MTSIINRLSAIVITAFWSICLPGSLLLGHTETPEERKIRLMENFANMTVTLQLDRTGKYMTGERAAVTIRITNPTANPVEIPDPNDQRVSRLYVEMRGGRKAEAYGVEWSTEESIPQPTLDAPSILIAPGQTITLNYNSDAERPDGTGTWIDGGSFAYTAGTYRVQYSLGGQVEFEVAAPVIEKSSVVILTSTDTIVDPNTGTEVLPLKTVVFAARVDNEHVVCVPLNSLTGSMSMEVDAQGRLKSTSVHTVEPFIRLATHPLAITALSAAADTADRITINYTTADGAPHLIHLDENRRPI